MKTLKDLIEKHPQGIMARIFSNVSKTSEHGDPVYCKFCKKEKSEVLEPNTEKIILLDCQCERHYKMLKEFVTANIEWINSPDDRNKEVPSYQGRERTHKECVEKAYDEYLQMTNSAKEI